MLIVLQSECKSATVQVFNETSWITYAIIECLLLPLLTNTACLCYANTHFTSLITHIHMFLIHFYTHIQTLNSDKLRSYCHVIEAHSSSGSSCCSSSSSSNCSNCSNSSIGVLLAHETTPADSREVCLLALV